MKSDFNALSNVSLTLLQNKFYKIRTKYFIMNDMSIIQNFKYQDSKTKNVMTIKCLKKI